MDSIEEPQATERPDTNPLKPHALAMTRISAVILAISFIAFGLTLRFTHGQCHIKSPPW
jgi:hypothetical protein